MGKQKKLRKKYHLSVTSDKEKQEKDSKADSDLFLPLNQPSENIFEGLNIDLSTVNSKLNDDTRSVKSYKSVKSEISGDKILPKKEKLKLRRELLLKKIDTVNQMKKELKIRNKRKNTAIIGDTNPLHDALPSLDSLLKNRKGVNCKSNEQKKKKGIEKASKRKKNLVQGVQTFKQILKNKDFQKNPLEAISGHVQALVQQQRCSVNKQVT